MPGLQTVHLVRRSPRIRDLFVEKKAKVDPFVGDLRIRQARGPMPE